MCAPRGLGNPPTLQPSQQLRAHRQPIAGPRGGGLVQGTLFPAAILPSSSRSPLLLMQPCRCSTNMNVVRARPRRTPRPCQVTTPASAEPAEGWAHYARSSHPVSLHVHYNLPRWLNWASFRAQPSVTGPGFSKEPDLCQGLPGGGGGGGVRERGSRIGTLDALNSLR